MSNTEQGRYFNQFDADKNYYEVRALAGRAPQSQEFNEMQAIQRQIVKQNFDVLFSNGTLQSGGSLQQNTNTPASITLAAAKYYFNGLVHEIPAQSFTLQGGTEYIGVLVSEEVLDATQDAALYDPAIGALNFGLPGANRKKITASWARSQQDTAFAGKPVYEFKNFIQQKYVSQSNIDPVNELLAARTYEESGNYTVNGYDLRLSQQKTAEGDFIVQVGNFFDVVGSTAYVMGRQIKTLNTLETIIKNSKGDTRFYPDLVTWTLGSADANGNYLLSLDEPTAVEVLSVRAVFTVKRPILSHIANGSDALTRTDEQLIQVLKVYQANAVGAAPTKVYLLASSGGGPGACYQQGNKLNWDVATPVIANWVSTQAYAPSSVVFYNSKNYQALQANTNITPGSDALIWQEVSLDEPTTGSYYVEALVEVLLPASAYELLDQDGQTYLNLKNTDGTTFQLSGEEWSAKPALGSTLRVEYNYGLPRIDPVFIDEKGIVSSKQGVPSENPAPPQVEGNKLVLGYVRVTPNLQGGKAVVVPFNNRRITMLELRQLVDRLSRAEMNQAIADLNAQATQKAAATISNLRGILTESFIYSFDDLQNEKSRRYESLSELTSDNILQLGEQGVFTVSTPSQDLGLISPVQSTSRKFLTLGYASAPRPVLQQPSRSSGLQVNQFDDYKLPPTISLEPATVQTDARYTLGTSAESYNAFKQIVINYQLDHTSYLEGKKKYGGDTSSNVADFAKADEEIKVVCSGFLANEIVEISVDGRFPKLKANSNTGSNITFLDPLSLGSAAAGTNGFYPVGTLIRCDSAGKANFSFGIPEGTPSGTAQVVVRQFEGLRAGVANLSIKSNLKQANAMDLLFPVLESDLLVENRIKPRLDSIHLLKQNDDKIEAQKSSNGQLVYDLLNNTNLKVRINFNNLAQNNKQVVASLPTTVEVILYVDSDILRKEFTKIDFIENSTDNLKYVQFDKSTVFTKVNSATTQTSDLNAVIGDSTKPFRMTVRLFNANSEPVSKGFTNQDLIVFKKNTQDPSSIVPSISLIKITPNGGSYTVSYTLTNGTPNGVPILTQIRS